VDDGPHRFSVTSIDARGRRSGTAYRAWGVDTSAPESPRLVEAPPLVTRSTQARFVVATAEQGVRVRCALDGAPVRCGSTLDTAEGAHRFAATAIDAAGNGGAEAAHEWRVDTTPPGAPVIADGGPPFAFTAEEGATFLCALDAGPALPCSSPHAYPGPLTGGGHTIAVRARDAAGNVGAAATTDWTVDAEPYRSAVVAAGPAGYWRLGETEWRAAAAATGSPGAYTGGVTLGVEGALPGDPDPAAEFDGSSGEVLLPGPTLSDSGTLEGWFKWSGIVALRDNTAGNGWILGLNAGGRLACRAGSATRQAVSTVPVASLTDDWHHLAVTKAGGTVGCYLDGRPVASIDGVPNTASVAPWHVMNNGTVSEQYSRGRADEIAIYARALTADAIDAHYRAGRPS
jgi:concanavalin A-like lectin/glucanase superfamily protein